MAGVNNWRIGLPYPEQEDPGAVEYLYEDDDGKTVSAFEDGRALAALLVAEQVILNSHWWEKSWPEAAKASVSVAADCSDVFAWGCADAENVPFREIEPLYRMWAKDPSWGVQVWCIIQRKEMPQRPVEKRIREGGIWDLDALQIEHDLRPNHYDGASGVIAGRKYRAYCDWERARGGKPLPFDSQWWSGWKEFTAANPGWQDDAWKAADTAALDEFKARAGFAPLTNQPAPAGDAARVQQPFREDQ